MEWLNYHHLLYFWTVAREGSVTKASEILGLAQPTVSGQLKALEESLDEKLFARSGRRLVLTDVGRTVYRYADEIFSLGRELQSTLKDRPTGRPVRFSGVSSRSGHAWLASSADAAYVEAGEDLALDVDTPDDLLLAEAEAATDGHLAGPHEAIGVD